MISAASLIGRSARRALGLARREVPYQMWHRWSVLRFGQFRAVTVPEGSLVVRSDDFRSFRIAQTGGTQREKIAVWRALAALEPDVAADVGANYGEFTIAITEFGFPIVAVEANTSIFSCLERTFADHPNVRLAHCAAGAVEGTTEFWMQSRSSGSGSMASGAPKLERAAAAARGELELHRVPMRTLSELVPREAATIPRSLILKIDVEGFETDVLDGAEDLLSSLDWWRAIVEFGPATIAAAGRTPEEVWRRLRKHRGVIVSYADRRRSAAHSAVAHAVHLGADALLPETPPGEVDVVVGSGRAVAQEM